MRLRTLIAAALLSVPVLCGTARAVEILQTETRGGHIYHLLSRSNWTYAEANAISLGGHLVTINDADEEQWVWSQFNPGQNRLIWIGLNDVREEGAYIWTSGEPIQYTNWASGQPSGDTPSSEEDCVQMGYGSIGSLPSFWNDYNCTRDDPGAISLHGVVELPPGAAPYYVWTKQDGSNGHAYSLITEPLPWPDARAVAMQVTPPEGFQPAHLATISGAAENEFLRATFGVAGPFWFYIGFTDETIEGEWRWIDSTPGIWQDPDNFLNPIQTAFVNWEPFEPNNNSGPEGGDYGIFNSTGQWNDGSEVGPPGPYVVEFKRRIHGDTDLDEDVDLSDLNNVRNHFGEGVFGGPTVEGEAYPFDGVVDLIDLNQVRNHFGEVGGAAPRAVPEPMGLVVGVVGAVALLAIRSSIIMASQGFMTLGKRKSTEVIT